jgi:protein-arginine kinase activator protein McsA
LPEAQITSEATTSSAESGNEFSGKSEADLKQMLNAAIEDEAYEKAGKIRDELDKRK